MVDWGKWSITRLLQAYEIASGIPQPEVGTKLDSLDDLKDALQIFSVAPSPAIAKNLIDSVFAECDVQSMTRLNATYSGWLKDLKQDETTIKALIGVADYLSNYDVKTSADFYTIHVLWGAELGNHYSEHDLANSGRLIDYAHKALQQGQAKAATDCMYQLYHYGEQGNYSPLVQEQLEDLFKDAMIAYIDADRHGAENWLGNERGVGGPNDSYEAAYYGAMVHLTQVNRSADRSDPSQARPKVF